jgi:hypothetical protein
VLVEGQQIPYLPHVADWLSSRFRFRTSEAVKVLDRLFHNYLCDEEWGIFGFKKFSRIHRTLQVLIYILSVMERCCISTRYATKHNTALTVALNWFELKPILIIGKRFLRHEPLLAGFRRTCYIHLQCLSASILDLFLLSGISSKMFFSSFSYHSKGSFLSVVY